MMSVIQISNSSTARASVKNNAQTPQFQIFPMATPTKKVNAELQVGPMSTLQQSVNNHSQVLVNCRHNKKLLGNVKAFDRHMNLVMVNVRELWTELPRKGKGRRNAVSKERFMSKLFVRGDSIILAIANPKKKSAQGGSK